MEVYRGATFQRVYQYLKRDKAGKNLDRFTYRDGAVEGTIEDLLTLILRYTDVSSGIVVRRFRSSLADFGHYTYSTFFVLMKIIENYF